MLGHLSFGVRDLGTHDAGSTIPRLPRSAMCASGPASAGSASARADGDERLTLFVRPEDAARPGPGFHLAFDAPTQAAVDAFHRRRSKPAAATPGRPACARTTAPPTTPLS